MDDNELLIEERLYQEAKDEIAELYTDFLQLHYGPIDIDACLEIAKQVEQLTSNKLREFYNARVIAQHQAELEQLASKYPNICLCNFEGKHPDRTHLEIARVEMHDTVWNSLNGRMRQCTPYPEYWYRCVGCGKEWNPQWKIENGRPESTMMYA